MSERRKPYEFSTQTKKEAREAQNNQCDWCGNKDKKGSRLEGNHDVAIWFAREVGISAVLIKSLANCTYLCQECHTYFHLQENRTQYAWLAWLLLKVDVDADESKDEWRKDKNHGIYKEMAKNKKRRKKKRRKGRSNARKRR